MKPLAFITLVRNEPYFLPRWLEYYGRTGADLYVLDHESDDGSTDRLPPGVARIRVAHPECERAMWMLRTVQEFMGGLLRDYARVGYAEVDEFLVPDPSRWGSLRELIGSNNLDLIPAQGWNVVHRPGDPDLPPVADLGARLLADRAWRREPNYDMSLIGSLVPNWKIGRHGMGDRPNGPDIGLRLVHLHYVHPELGWTRILDRKRGKPFAPDGCGFQNKFWNRGQFDEHWAEVCSVHEPIPPEWCVV